MSEKSKEQHREFVEAARKAGASEDDVAFDDMLKRVASAPAPKTVQKRKKAAKPSGNPA